ncbi:MAG: signal peptidase I, partial [Bacilli bacterium]
GDVLWIAYIILEKRKIPTRDLIYMELQGSKRENDYYKIFPEEEIVKKHHFSNIGKANHIIGIIIDYYLVILFALFVVSMLFSFVCFSAKVNQSSMESTLTDGDRVFVVDTKKFESGDIIVFYYDSDIQAENGISDNELLIKRVIGVPGDSFSCIDGVLYINGEAQTEEYVTYIQNSSYDLDSIIENNSNKANIDNTSGTIPEGYYIMLGDNRIYSNDSEEFGLVKDTQIIGVVKYYKNSAGWHKTR